MSSGSGDVRAIAQCAQLLPGDRRVDLAVAGKRTEAAVGAGDHALDADDGSEALDALCDELGVLDVIGAGVDEARREYLVLGNLRLGPDLPLVLVARVPPRTGWSPGA